MQEISVNITEVLIMGNYMGVKYQALLTGEKCFKTTSCLSGWRMKLLQPFKCFLLHCGRRKKNNPALYRSASMDIIQ